MNLNDAKALADLLIEKHLHTATDKSWRFRWSNDKTAFGVCNYRDKTIYLSSHLTKYESEASVEDTILHEIAHAKTPGSGHNRLWKMVARALGADPTCSKKSEMKEDPTWLWVLVLGDEIIRGYYRRPNKSTIEKIRAGKTWVRGRKAETQGKLEIVGYRAFKRKNP